MKLVLAVALSTLAGLAAVSAASAETVIIRRGGHHRPHFHPHPYHHSHRTVIIHR